MYPHYIELLFMRNVPHILEIILFSLDYESYYACFKVSKAWKELLTSDNFQRKGKYVFGKDVSEDETKLYTENDYVPERSQLTSESNFEEKDVKEKSEEKSNIEVNIDVTEEVRYEKETRVKQDPKVKEDEKTFVEEEVKKQDEKMLPEKGNLIEENQMPQEIKQEQEFASMSISVKTEINHADEVNTQRPNIVIDDLIQKSNLPDSVEDAEFQNKLKVFNNYRTFGTMYFSKGNMKKAEWAFKNGIKQSTCSEAASKEQLRSFYLAEVEFRLCRARL